MRRRGGDRGSIVTSHSSAPGDELAVGDPGAVAERPVWALAADAFSALRGGDQAGLERLVRLLTPVLWHIVRAYGLTPELAEDVIQATWLALIVHAASIVDPKSVMRWITTTARREAWRVAHARQRERSAELSELEPLTPAVAGPETTVLANGAARVLWLHVLRLSERCQRLLRIIAFDSRPDYTSLAAELGMSVGGVGPTRRRCLDKLRELLAGDREWVDREQ